MLPGLIEITFKDRFGNHKKWLNHVNHKNDTELSKEFWEIKKGSGTTKAPGKLSECVVLTIQIVSADFYV